MRHEAAGPARLSIAICSHNRGRQTERCLAALAPLPETVEAIVIDSGSAPDQAETIRAAATQHGARHLRLPTPGLSEARNAALASARGDWIAYLDDDATPWPDWCAVLLRTIAADPDLAATGGLILPQWQAQLPGWWPPALRAVLTIIDPPCTDESTAGLDPYGANIAFRREVLTRLGGFPTCLGRRGRLMISNEETYVLRRLRQSGLSVRFTPDLVVYHEIDRARLNPVWLVGRQYWSGVSEAVMLGALGEKRLHRAARFLLHALLLAPLGLLPAGSTAQIGLRCKAAYARGFLRGTLGEGRAIDTALP
ncbi:MULTISPECIES: glycosyltransferase family 2 protein [unclassified Acidiphilium]|uniref:glycosyltransferase family 2 protein n=1 Tax=unclassified Acidiphilium TaxID=2617493 RepID=UPI000BD8E00E|nr:MULTISPECIES: glycosyltransferase [unclassified Acidiphilium]OYV56127.1 MAG: glycosyl transferase [Acidiphilium sp. 20-67-58]HQT61308.1 glycosyltransferase [Acidiphilium sp.]